MSDNANKMGSDIFLLTPLREGRRGRRLIGWTAWRFLLTPLREGRPVVMVMILCVSSFLLTPLREGRQQFSTSPS